MVVSFILTVVGNLRHLLCEIVVIGKNGTAVAVASEVFGRKEGGGPCDADSSGSFLCTVGACVPCSDGLCVVFDDVDIVFFSQGHDLVHIGALSEQVYGHDGFGAGCDMRFDVRRSDIKSEWIYIDHDGLQSEECDDFGGGDVGEGGHDDLVTRL